MAAYEPNTPESVIYDTQYRFRRFDGGAVINIDDMGYNEAQSDFTINNGIVRLKTGATLPNPIITGTADPVASDGAVGELYVQTARGAITAIWYKTTTTTWLEFAGGGTSSGITAVSTNSTLEGDGTSGNPLGVADDAISKAKLDAALRTELDGKGHSLLLNTRGTVRYNGVDVLDGIIATLFRASGTNSASTLDGFSMEYLHPSLANISASNDLNSVGLGRLVGRINSATVDAEKIDYNNLLNAPAAPQDGQDGDHGDDGDDGVGYEFLYTKTASNITIGSGVVPSGTINYGIGGTADAFTWTPEPPSLGSGERLWRIQRVIMGAPAVGADVGDIRWGSPRIVGGVGADGVDGDDATGGGLTDSNIPSHVGSISSGADQFVFRDETDDTYKRATFNRFPFPSSSTTTRGVVELATEAETLIGTDTTRVITPRNINALLRRMNVRSVPFYIRSSSTPPTPQSEQRTDANFPQTREAATLGGTVQYVRGTGRFTLPVGTDQLWCSLATSVRASSTGWEVAFSDPFMVAEPTATGGSSLTGQQIATLIDGAIGTDWRTGGGSSFDPATLTEENDPLNIISSRRTSETYSASASRTPALTANTESSSTMRLAIADHRGFGANTVGGGELIFRKLSTNTAATQPDTFKLVYLGLNQSGNNLLLQTDQITGFQVGTITINRQTVSSVNFFSQTSVVRYNGHQTRYAVIAESDDIVTPFRGTNPTEVTISIAGYEVLTEHASEETVKTPASEFAKHSAIIPLEEATNRSIKRVSALTFDGSDSIVYLEDDWTSTETAAQISFIRTTVDSNADNFIYAAGIQPEISGNRHLGSKEHDTADRIYGVRIRYNADNTATLWLGLRSSDISSRTPSAIVVNGTEHTITATSSSNRGTINVGATEYMILQYTIGSVSESFTLPATLGSTGTFTYNINLKFTDDTLLFATGRNYVEGLYVYDGNVPSLYNDHTKLRFVDRIPDTVTANEPFIVLRNGYNTGHRGLDYTLSFVSNMRRMAIFGGILYLGQQERGASRVVAVNQATGERMPDNEVDLSSLTNSIGGVGADSGHIYVLDSANGRLLAFTRTDNPPMRDLPREANFDLSGAGIRIPVGIISTGSHILIGDFGAQDIKAFSASSGTRDPSADISATALRNAGVSIFDDFVYVNDVPISYIFRSDGTNTVFSREDSYQGRYTERDTAPAPTERSQDFNLLTDVIYVINDSGQVRGFFAAENRALGTVSHSRYDRIPSAYEFSSPTHGGISTEGIASNDTHILVGDSQTGTIFVIDKKTRVHQGNTQRFFERGVYEAQSGSYVHQDIIRQGQVLNQPPVSVVERVVPLTINSPVAIQRASTSVFNDSPSGHIFGTFTGTSYTADRNITGDWKSLVWSDRTITGSVPRFNIPGNFGTVAPVNELIEQPTDEQVRAVTRDNNDIKERYVRIKRDTGLVFVNTPAMRFDFNTPDGEIGAIGLHFRVRRHLVDGSSSNILETDHILSHGNSTFIIGSQVQDIDQFNRGDLVSFDIRLSTTITDAAITSITVDRVFQFCQLGFKEAVSTVPTPVLN